MPEILFVCMANRFRSPLAAALFEKRLRDRGLSAGWTVASAGTWVDVPGQPAHPAAVAEAQKLGLDLSGHRSREVTCAMIEHADLVLVMTRGQKEALRFEFALYRSKVLMLSELAEGIERDIPDPVLKNFENCGADVLDLSSEICHAFDNILSTIASFTNLLFEY